MKSGLVASAALHAAVLTWGLWSLAPKPLEATNAESLPVELVTMSDFSASVKGEKDAPKTDKPAPKPTTKPQKLPMPAENVGDNETDLETPPTPVDRPKPTEQAAAAQSAPPPPPPQPKTPPAPKKETPPPPPKAEKAPEPKPEPAKATPPEPAPDAVEKAIAEAKAEPEKAPEPDPAPQNVPTPEQRPTPPAPTPETKVADAKPRPDAKPTKKEDKVADKQTPEENKFDADQIAALLNREKSAGGGAKRSSEAASLGGRRTTGAALSMSELDALRGQIQQCWSPPSGVSEAGSLRISISMQLDPSGNLETRPTIVDGGDGSMIARVAGEAALRAVERCAPYKLPADKYDTWSNVVVNFDPSQMF